MTCRLDEIHAGMHTIVHNIHAVDLVFGVKIGIKSLLDVVYDRLPGFLIVHEITETRGIDHGKS